ncbi:hypothetical protein [Sorangium atrum]|uniref:Uncharacterized protein n=1 Tax=Sorangium atrum TaxID=2995308 RepID=A0ABT5BVB6_9BACT|nr:hypothetical protein [Sorangium aterium]MDC0677643.1 hypothetical protein [Sorangium aterium]
MAELRFTTSSGPSGAPGATIALVVRGGSGQALGELNAVAERLQAETLRARGLGHLLEVVTPE